MKPSLPSGLVRAKEIAARVASPLGRSLAAKKEKKTCKLYLYDSIGKDWLGGISPQDVVAILDENQDAESLDVYVNSPGGYVFDGIAIYNAIRRFDGPKTVYVDGIAASIASIIALAGDKVVTMEGGTWMIHDPWSGIFAVGTADEIESAAAKEVAALRKIRETLLDIYVNATGQSVADLSAWMTGETWMTAQEALDRGFTDEIQKQEPPAEPEAPEDKRKDAAPSAYSLDTRIQSIDAAASRRRERFAGASPDTTPGRPGHTPTSQKAGKS